MGKTDIFFLYDSNDSETVSTINKELKERNLTTWFASEHYSSGDLRESKAKEALENSRSAMICVGPGIASKDHQIFYTKKLSCEQNKTIFVLLLPKIKEVPEDCPFLEDHHENHHIVKLYSLKRCDEMNKLAGFIGDKIHKNVTMIKCSRRENVAHNLNVLLLLVSLLFVVGWLFNGAITIPHKDFTALITLVILVVLDLLVTVINFGLLKNSKAEIGQRVGKWQTYYKFSGPIAGFLVCFILFMRFFNSPAEMLLQGNVCFVKDAQCISGVPDAEIALSFLQYYHPAKTNKDGNFELRFVPNDSNIQEIEIQVMYNGQIFYSIIERSSFSNARVKIPLNK